MKNSKLVQYYYLGKGAFKKMADCIQARRTDASVPVVVVIDHFFKDKNLLDLSCLKSHDMVLWADTTDEPTTDYVDELTEKAKKLGVLPAAVVGIGGGSTLDIAKAISVLLTNEGKSAQYQGWDLVKNPPVYKIGIPTIAGTGAEFTRTAVLTGPVKKLGINSDYSVYDQVILDPELIKTVPKEQFVYTAMDCFVHNCESLLGMQNDAMTIALAQKSSDMIKEVFLGEMDYEKLLVASSMGGLAIANSNVGICHPFSYGLGYVLGLHHAFAICIAFNQLGAYYPEVETFKKILQKNNIVLPKIITEDITPEQLDHMAELTLMNEKPLSNAFGPEWRSVFGKEKVIELLKRM
jgi:3-deoxy-alpha-D-manno-octulosonate 8-oxidase